MKKLMMLLVLVLAACTMEAQEPVWNTNLEQAIDISNKTNKPMLLFFTGSDWCIWCKRLQGEVFKKPEFAAWAKNNVVLVEVDFPKNTPIASELKDQNGKLQQFFGVQGYPTVWFVTAKKVNGQISFEKIGNTGYVAGGPTPWIAGADGILKKK